MVPLSYLGRKNLSGHLNFVKNTMNKVYVLVLLVHLKKYKKIGELMVPL